ncbi:unnamed protein product [Pleuronectes platessa]|uniref:Uncharacterized protein n=1 Tax=Pleuronectes platessa TaxID=8262 RepID=A0A9N7UHI0_PLEPL|nr:unnamed protein product [Pleuronectes platessa]
MRFDVDQTEAPPLQSSMDWRGGEVLEGRCWWGGAGGEVLVDVGEEQVVKNCSQRSHGGGLLRIWRRAAEDWTQTRACSCSMFTSTSPCCRNLVLGLESI